MVYKTHKLTWIQCDDDLVPLKREYTYVPSEHVVGVTAGLIRWLNEYSWPGELITTETYSSMQIVSRKMDQVSSLPHPLALVLPRSLWNVVLLRYPSDLVLSPQQKVIVDWMDEVPPVLADGRELPFSQLRNLIGRPAF